MELRNIFLIHYVEAGLHKLWYPVVRDRSTWSKFGAHGERGDVFGELCSGLASEGEKQAYIC